MYGEEPQPIPVKPVTVRFAADLPIPAAGKFIYLTDEFPVEYADGHHRAEAFTSFTGAVAYWDRQAKDYRDYEDEDAPSPAPGTGYLWGQEVDRDGKVSNKNFWIATHLDGRLLNNYHDPIPCIRRVEIGA